MNLHPPILEGRIIMLIEVFSDTIYDIDNDSERKIPRSLISETGGNVNKYYEKARKFILGTVDTIEYQIAEGGLYMLEIELHSKTTANDSITCSATDTKELDRYTFRFKFNSLQHHLDKELSKTIHGTVVIDEYLNVIEFTRDSVTRFIKNSTTIIRSRNKVETVTVPKLVNDPSSSSGKSLVFEEKNLPFDSSCQQIEPSETEDAGSDITNESKSVELSEHSFSVKGSTINVSHPEMEIGTVKDGSLSIDVEKQRLQDEFLRNMSQKMSKRNRQLGL